MCSGKYSLIQNKCVQFGINGHPKPQKNNYNYLIIKKLNLKLGKRQIMA
jgi:hypothetical protein